MMEKSDCPITKLSTIVVAVDNSAHSEKALIEALSLAKACSTQLYALSVVEINEEFASLAPEAVERKSGAVKKLLDSISERAKKENIRCSVISHTGEDPAQFIVEEAKKLNADMIVMGKHGSRKSLTKFVMGSVTAKVLSHTPCNVLVIVN
ncbi:MAG: universal stress protein [Nitrospiraceae bacterium]|nr:MAG: universal stress protein [Nitrospiraceae bacterium]